MGGGYSWCIYCHRLIFTIYTGYEKQSTKTGVGSKGLTQLFSTSHYNCLSVLSAQSALNIQLGTRRLCV